MRNAAQSFLHRVSRRERFRRSARIIAQAWRDLRREPTPHTHLFDSKQRSVDVGHGLCVLFCRCGAAKLFGHW